MGEKKLENFFSQFKFLRYKKGETILRSGDIPQGVYYLKKGYVRLYSLSESGQELSLIIFKPGDFFPIMWAINNTPNTQYLQAMTAVELWRCPREKFVLFIKENPDVFFELTSHMLERLGGILQRMEYMAFGNAYSKVVSIILICAQRFGEKKGSEIEIQVPLTHKDIAALLGVARETVSIELKKLERKGLMKYKKRLIFIKNKKRLEKESALL